MLPSPQGGKEPVIQHPLPGPSDAGHHDSPVACGNNIFPVDDKRGRTGDHLVLKEFAIVLPFLDILCGIAPEIAGRIYAGVSGGSPGSIPASPARRCVKRVVIRVIGH